MYSAVEREQYLQTLLSHLTQLKNVEGIVQLGSGVEGYKDEYSDIDLMVSTDKDVDHTRSQIENMLREMGAYFTKVGKFSDQVYLLIPFFENGLEMNISVLPTENLNVKSPLWKVLFDRSGNIQIKMDEENKQFLSKKQPYPIAEDIGFEFMYHMRKFNVEIKRSNIIFALKMLEAMRGLTLQIQVVNEGKKLHQFKAYDTLSPKFNEELVNTYPTSLDLEGVVIAAENLESLFIETIKKNEFLIFDEQSLKLKTL